MSLNFQWISRDFADFDAIAVKRMKIGQYCQRQRCRHFELEQFWQAFASRGFVSDSWAFLLLCAVAVQWADYTSESQYVFHTNAVHNCRQLLQWCTVSTEQQRNEWSDGLDCKTMTKSRYVEATTVNATVLFSILHVDELLCQPLTNTTVKHRSTIT